MHDPLLATSPIESLYQQRLANPDRGQIEALQGLEWTSHNIALSSDCTTFAGRPHTRMDDEPRTRTIAETLRLMASRQGSLAGLRLLDLGCLEGGLSLEMARRGAEVVGVEGRQANFDKCQALQRYFALPNLEFLHLDVRRLDAETHGRFDIVLCCGLLYHLSEPFMFLRRLRTLIEDAGLLFVDTHVAPEDDAAVAACRLGDKLSSLEVLPSGGVDYPGRWFDEFATERGAEHPWDSISNPKSFWPTHQALRRALYQSRFDYLVDVYGTFDPDREQTLRREFSRVYCAATMRQLRD